MGPGEVQTLTCSAEDREEVRPGDCAANEGEPGDRQRELRLFPLRARFHTGAVAVTTSALSVPSRT